MSNLGPDAVHNSTNVPIGGDGNWTLVSKRKKKNKRKDKRPKANQVHNSQIGKDINARHAQREININAQVSDLTIVPYEPNTEVVQVEKGEDIVDSSPIENKDMFTEVKEKKKGVSFNNVVTSYTFYSDDDEDEVTESILRAPARSCGGEDVPSLTMVVYNQGAKDKCYVLEDESSCPTEEPGKDSEALRVIHSSANEPCD
ncbi:unnamed protein product [Rhodiola kirilowii]